MALPEHRIKYMECASLRGKCIKTIMNKVGLHEELDAMHKEVSKRTVSKARQQNGYTMCRPKSELPTS